MLGKHLQPSQRAAVCFNRLIRSLVTSNPSPGYIHRVANAPPTMAPACGAIFVRF